MKSVQIRTSPLNTAVTLRDSLSGDFQFTLIDARHCPGSVMWASRSGSQGGIRILLEGSFGTFFHTGDARLEEQHWKRVPCLEPFLRSAALQCATVDALFLDVTFANPACCFPPKLASLRHMEQLLLSFPREAPISLHCGWLGTEEMIETVLAVFPLEAVGVASRRRKLEVELALPHLAHRFRLVERSKRSNVPRLVVGRHPKVSDSTTRFRFPARGDSS
eukprot:Polyplicarium_translucidae@DN3153_c0_g1_i10.p3